MSKPPHRLLLVINHLYPAGGAEAQLVHLARGLAKLGHEVTVCCIDASSIDNRPLEAAGVDVVSLQASTRLGRFAAIPRLTRLARRADAVLCTMWDASLWGRIAAILARRPAIVADHSTDRSVQVSAGGAARGRWIALHNRLLDRFTYATVICAGSQRAVLESEGVAPEKIVHIPNGIPVAELAAAAASGPTRAELGIPDATPLAMQVGVFRFEKNQLGALEAFSEVRRAVPDAQLVFVGDGPMREQVQLRAREIGAGEWAHFLGVRTDVPALLPLAELMLLPSTADAMPMTVLEAMALGVPVLASDVGDVRATLEGRAGRCVPAGDAHALAEACVEMLSDGPGREAMGRAGAEIAARLDSSAMAERYAALFEDACANSRRPPHPPPAHP